MGDPVNAQSLDPKVAGVKAKTSERVDLESMVFATLDMEFMAKAELQRE